MFLGSTLIRCSAVFFQTIFYWIKQLFGCTNVIVKKSHSIRSPVSCHLNWTCFSSILWCFITMQCWNFFSAIAIAAWIFVSIQTSTKKFPVVAAGGPSNCLFVNSSRTDSITGQTLFLPTFIPKSLIEFSLIPLTHLPLSEAVIASDSLMSLNTFNPSFYNFSCFDFDYEIILIDFLTWILHLLTYLPVAHFCRQRLNFFCKSAVSVVPDFGFVNAHFPFLFPTIPQKPVWFLAGYVFIIVIFLI